MRFISILVLLFAVGSANAAASAAQSFEAGVETRNHETISATTGLDTLSGADSLTIELNNPLDPGWNYHIVRDAFTGTDSVDVIVYVDNLDFAGNLLYRTAVDTFTAATGEAIALPLWETALGPKFRIKLVSTADTGGQLILNRMYLIARRAVQVVKSIR